MKVCRNIVDLNDTCVAVGGFDAVHKGHKKVIERLVREAAQRGLKSVVVSTPPKGRILTTEREKERLMEGYGPDYFMTASPYENLISVLIERLGVKLIVTGENDPAGEYIERQARENGIELITVETERLDGEIIGARGTRGALTEGDFERYYSLCGHPYTIIGKVIHGQGRGHTVGMPTANLETPSAKIMPKAGVYDTFATVEGRRYLAVTNIGTRPSVDDMDYVTIEAFIQDFSKDIYDREIELEINGFIREIKKFPGLLEVKAQVEKDIALIRMLHPDLP